MCQTNPRFTLDIYFCDLQMWTKVIADTVEANVPMECFYGANHVPVGEISDEI